MKIAILTSGILPVPAVLGGAVENLIDFYLEYNNQHCLHDITVYSIWHPDVKKHVALLSKVNHYKYVNVSGAIATIKKNIYRILHSNEYYNYQTEYYFEQSYKDLKKECFDCIILENRPGYAYKLSKRGIKNLVLHLHNDHLHHGSKHAKYIFESLEKIITVSDYIKQRVQTIDSNDKVKTVYNGIDNNSFSLRHVNQSIKRKDIGLSDEDFVIVYSGRINIEKGISELIDAMLILKDYRNIKLLILGSSFFGNANNDNCFVKKLKAKTVEISDRIVFTGFIPYVQMPNYISMADIAIIPSVWDDPFPTTVLEAQAMELPIITTRKGGIPEEVSEENAILLEINEQFPKNLASAILDLYQTPEKCKKMSLVSLKRSKMFNKNEFSKNFFSAVESINTSKL